MTSLGSKKRLFGDPELKIKRVSGVPELMKNTIWSP
jgi:hypothetical protein